MPDWSTVYASEVAPVMARFGEGPPTGVWIGLGGVALVGVALLVFGNGSVRLAGLVPLGAVAFVGFMVWSGGQRVDQPARYRIGTITALRTEKVVTSTTRGVDEPRIVYFATVDVTSSAHFDADGARALETRGPEELIVDEALYAQLTEGEAVTAVSMPGAEQAVAFVLGPEGKPIR
ncbi:MAG: hypothetical protein EP330_11605 [Deltaproteobacteria bacterium]|nr:MAG: hypothetical protein EP330_11605 [Deltaproteobacteria bacterium]